MAPPPIMNEEDIWNYKSTSSRRENSGKGRCSKILSSKGGKKKMAVSTQDPENLVIDVDLEEDFSFIHMKPISNEQSTKQWATVFSKRENVKSDDGQRKISVSQKEKNKTSSKSIFHRKQNSSLKGSLVNDKNESQTYNCKDFVSYFSPLKGSPKKRKVSGPVEYSSSFSEETDDVKENSAFEISDDEDILSISEIKTSESTAQTDIEKERGIDMDEGSLSLHGTDCKNKAQIVDVIVIGEEDDDGLKTENNACSMDIVSDSDLWDVDQDSAGGFLKNDDVCDENGSHHSALQFFTDVSSKATPCNATTDDKYEIPSDSFPSTSNDGNSIAISMPLSTAARKQTSLFSFFASSKSTTTSNPWKLSEHGRGNKSYPIQQNHSRPCLTKSVSYPPQKRNSRAGGQPVPSKSMSVSKNTPASDSHANKSYHGRQRQCPFYKKIPGTNITVDAFRYGVIPGCDVYFLTHFHYDHYGGLTKKFTQPIYCSEVTGNLVERRLGVAKQWIHRLPLWRPVQIDGVTLTLMEANHCPGAVIVLFETINGKKILHTGDFRASLEMEEYPALKNIVVDELYLDTTYCNPSYAFPDQKSVIDFTVRLVEKKMTLNPKTLIVCGAYTIGKERIFAAIAKKLDSKICVMSDKKKVLDCLDDDDLKKRLTLDWSEGQVHVLPMAKLKQEALFDHHLRHSRFTSILAFEPTGWTHSDKSISLENLKPKWSRNGVTLYGVPYSEHSSYLEMKQFVQFIRPKKILPTVNNGTPAASKKMEDIFKLWLTEESPSGCDKDGARSSQKFKMDDWMAT